MSKNFKKKKMTKQKSFKYLKKKKKKKFKWVKGEKNKKENSHNKEIYLFPIVVMFNIID